MQPAKPINTANLVHIHIDPGLIARYFSRHLSKGVRCKACLPCGLKQLLCPQIGLPADYVDNRVQTVFLNGKPVDDVDAAQVKAGDTIALSAAMPGLLGAVLRKGGYYSAMRREITHQDHCAVSESQDSFITVKLFNLTVREAAPLLLQYGIWMSGPEIVEWLQDGGDELQAALQELVLNGKNVHPVSLAETLAQSDLVFVQVNP